MTKSKSKSAKGGSMPGAAVLNKAKDAGVTKGAKLPQAKTDSVSREISQKKGKQSKHNKVKEPSPETESESDLASASSASETESESEVEAPVKNGALNGVDAAKRGTAAIGTDSGEDSDDESVSSESSGEPATNGIQSATRATKHAPQKPSMDSDGSEDSDDSAVAAPAAANAKGPALAESSDDSDDSDSEEESEAEHPITGKKRSVVNGRPEKKIESIMSKNAPKDESEDSKDSEDSDEQSDKENVNASDSSEELDEEETEPKRAASKRKAEAEAMPAAKKFKNGADTANSQSKNLFVGSLSWNVDEQWLTRDFEKFGELLGVRVITDRNTGRSKGFGYVEFAKAEDAAKAHAEMQGADLDNRTINVDFALPRNNDDQKDKFQPRAKVFGDQPGNPTDTLWIGNLSFQMEQDQVSEAFQDFGTVMGVRLPTDRETGAPKGFGYVTYSSVDEAQAALESMQGAQLAGRSIRLDYSQPRQSSGDSPARGGRGGGRGGFGDRGRGGFGGRGGGGGRGSFQDRGGRGGGRGGRGGTSNRGGFGDFSGKKTTF